MLHRTFPLLMACAILPAQGLGITLGASRVQPQSLEAIQPKATVAFMGGVSYELAPVTFGLTYRAKAGGEIQNQNQGTGDPFAWGYTGATLTLKAPFGGYLGAEFRRETMMAENHLDKSSVSATKNRLWGKVGFEYEARNETATTAVGVAALFTNRQGYDAGATYTPQQALTLYAPTVEFQAYLTVRF